MRTFYSGFTYKCPCGLTKVLQISCKHYYDSAYTSWLCLRNKLTAVRSGNWLKGCYPLDFDFKYTVQITLA